MAERQEMEAERPPSPGICPLQLEDCLQPLLKFTLMSAIDETLGLDLGLSKEYCSCLLQDDPSSPSPTASEHCEGVPRYPLYLHLASALSQSINSGVLCGMNKSMPPIHENSSSNQKEHTWTKLIAEKGSELVKILKSMDFQLHVQEPFFSQLKDGCKTVEGRCSVGGYKRIGSGALILFNKCLVLQVQGVRFYASFSDMLKAEGLAKVLPGVETLEEGVRIYKKFYSEEKEKSNGVLAISVIKPSSQLSNCLATMLSQLSYGGVQMLLGLGYTAGTISEALPPPRSALLTSFVLPHNNDVKSSILTDGARALAKHVNRSRERFWGSFFGSG